MQRTSTILLLIIGLMWLDLTVSRAYLAGQMLHYNPINGDFQTYNPLRRMAEGQAPGKDFQPYMGLGITYATYLPFTLLGETFSASKFSAQLMHMWLFGLSSLVLFRLLRFSWVAALASGFILQIYAYICTDYLYQFSVDWKIANTSLPFSQTLAALSHAENSCLGIRVALPFLTAGLLLIIYKLKPKISTTWEAMLWGFIAGAQAFWSNDFGFSSMAALSFAYLVFRWKLKPSFFDLAVHFWSIVIGFITLFTITTHGYPLRALGYNFGGVAKDQFWYFMLDETGKVFSLMQYIEAKRIFILAGISATLIGGIFLYLWRQKKADLRDVLFLYILGTSLVAGLISTIGGGIMDRYFAASLRLMPFAILFVAIKFIPPLPRQYNNYILILAVVCGGIFHLAFQPVSIWNLEREVHTKTDGRFFYSDWAGGYLSNSQKKEMEIAQHLKNKKVFSTYSSLMDAASGNFQPSKIDYIIHALGRDNRESYLKTFAKTDADYVTTPNELWTLWEVWSRRVNWWFYREMIKKYEPVSQTAYHVVWKKRAQKLDTKTYVNKVQCHITYPSLRATSGSAAIQKEKDWIATSASPPRDDGVLLITDTLLKGTYYVELTVHHKTTLQNSGVPVIGNRALMVVEEQSSGFNAVNGKNIATPDIRTYNVDYTLNPQTLVLEHKAGIPSILRLRVAPKDRASLTINNCQVSGVYDFPFPSAGKESAAY